MLKYADYLEFSKRIDSGEYKNLSGNFEDVSEKFYQDACKALNIRPESNLSKLIYDRAYQEAHSSGWGAILDEMDDLVDFSLEVCRIMVDETEA